VLIAFGIVLWLALRYLRYTEFDSFRHVVLGSAFRRTLAADLAVRELETAIHAADSIEECWLAVENSGQTFGIARATMRVYGRTFSAHFDDSNECCDLTVNLNGAGTIELSMARVPAPLADSLRTTLAPKLAALRPKLALAAAAGRRR
jgi:hypothetical protein